MLLRHAEYQGPPPMPPANRHGDLQFAESWPDYECPPPPPTQGRQDYVEPPERVSARNLLRAQHTSMQGDLLKSNYKMEPDDIRELYQAMALEMLQLGISDYELYRRSERSLILRYDLNKLLRYGGDVEQFCSRVTSFMERLLKNKGSDPHGRLSKQDIDAMCLTDDFCNFGDRLTSLRVNHIAHSRRVPPVAVYMLDATCTAVLHPPGFQIISGCPPTRFRDAGCAMVTKNSVHRTSPNIPLIIIGASGVGKTPLKMLSSKPYAP